MAYLFILVCSLGFAITGHPLIVSNTVYLQINEHPSCLLLKHRSTEREKVIRELEHIMALDFKDPINKLMTENTLINNKLFLDQAVWDDVSTNLFFEVTLSAELKDKIEQVGLEQVFFRIQGPGLSWTSYLNQFPPEVEYLLEGDNLKVKYPIYLNTYCLHPERSPELFWFGPSEVAEDFENTHETSLELLESLEQTIP